MITRSSRSVPDRLASPFPAYPDPVDGLLHAAVANRPLEDVVQLITLLEQSAHSRAAADVLRAVGTDRSVEDVTRLVAVLSRPPHQADDADEMIRAAAERRPVEDVVELIGRLAQERSEPVRPADPPPSAPDVEQETGPPEIPAVPAIPAGPGTPADVTTAARPASWAGRLAAVALALCGAAYFPLHGDGLSVTVLGTALAVPLACVVLAVLTVLRPGRPVLVACVALPTALAAAQLLLSRVDSAASHRAVQVTAAPPWVAGPAAVLAAMATLAAVLVWTAARRPDDRPTGRAATPAHRPPEPEQRLPDSEQRLPDSEQRLPDSEQDLPDSEQRPPVLEHRPPLPEHRPAVPEHRPPVVPEHQPPD